MHLAHAIAVDIKVLVVFHVWREVVWMLPHKFHRLCPKIEMIELIALQCH